MRSTTRFDCLLERRWRAGERRQCGCLVAPGAGSWRLTRADLRPGRPVLCATRWAAEGSFLVRR
eukprot:7694081-Lingulodinium_polyedra.AAC.1